MSGRMELTFHAVLKLIERLVVRARKMVECIEAKTEYLLTCRHSGRRELTLHDVLKSTSIAQKTPRRSRSMEHSMLY